MNSAVEMLRRSDILFIGKELISGVLGGLPRRFLKWSYQLDIRLLDDPPLTRVVVLDPFPDNSLIVFHAARCLPPMCLEEMSSIIPFYQA